MKIEKSALEKIKENKVFILILVVFLIVLIAISCAYFLKFRFARYVIKTNNYSFEIKIPKGWVAKELAYYSEENIEKSLSQCKENTSSFAYEIGRFKFMSQRYPDNFGQNGDFESDYSSGAILEIKIGCMGNPKNAIEINNQFGKIQIANEKTIESFFVSGFGNSKSLSFFHNNFQYEISENVYVSPQDKLSEQKIKDKYFAALSNIISSIKFDDRNK